MKKVLTLALLLSAATAAHAEIYTWRDAGGTAHYTNSLHEIPARFLRRAKLLDVATGKATPLSAAQAVAKAPATAAQGGGATSAPLATAVPQTAPAPPAASGVIPTANASAPAPAAVATIPQPQPQQTRGYPRRRMHGRGSTGEGEE